MPSPDGAKVIAFDPNRSRRGSRSRPRPVRPVGASLDSMLDSWRFALEQEDKSPKTIRSYTDSLKALIRYLETHGLPADTEGVMADDMRAFLHAEKERTSASSAAVHFRNLRVFWNWVGREGDRVAPSPMTNVERPKVTEKAHEYLDDEQLVTLLRVCEGNGLEDRRDTAVIRIFIDNGVRISGLANLRFDPQDESKNDVFLAKKRLRIRLKGGDEIWVPIGKKAVAAIDRYLRARRKHIEAHERKAAKDGRSVQDWPWLWVGLRGRGVAHMTDSGVRQMLKRRGEEAGIPHLHPHRFRATFADDYLENGGTVDGLMAIAGWSSYAMPQRYAGERAAERARQAHEHLSPGDRI